MALQVRWLLVGALAAWPHAIALAQSLPERASAAPPAQQAAPAAVTSPAQSPEPSPAASPPASAPAAPATEKQAGASPATEPAAAKPAQSSETPAQPVATPRAPEFALDMARTVPRAQLRGAGSETRDRATLQAFYAARNGAPLWVTSTGRTPAAAALVQELRKADAFGLDPAAYTLPAVKPAGSDTAGLDHLALDETEISGAILRYARHARGGRVDPLQITKYLDRKPQRFDDLSVLTQIAVAEDAAQYLRDLHPKHPQFEALLKAYQASRGAADKGASARRLLANLEQWRWMPHDLGRFYVTVNVPEYTLRVVSDGRVVHTERVIVGKIDTQTPIFSDEMEQVIFHPFWGVPTSIKQNEVLPSLRGNGAVLAKYNLRIQVGGRDVDPRSVDWSKFDIRNAHVYQPPGKDNVLGVVKFRFPNKHDVYMHDTPTKSLFQQTVRTYSHGCMRVQNPVRLAELILAEDKQMSPDRVRALTVAGAPENNQLNLTRRVPVHITYFTASIDETGAVKTFKDIYGHEERIGLGLEGKFAQIKPVPEPKGPDRAEPVASLSEQWFGGGWSSGGSGGKQGGWSRDAFGGN